MLAPAPRSQLPLDPDTQKQGRVLDSEVRRQCRAGHQAESGAGGGGVAGPDDLGVPDEGSGAAGGSGGLASRRAMIKSGI